MHLKQRGFAHLEIIIVLLVVIIVAAVGFYVLGKKPKSQEVNATNAGQVASESKAKIQHLGINLDYYNPTTNRAGDLMFTRATFAAGPEMQKLFTDYGFQIPGNSANGGQARRSPQPTFIVPLGTKVHALVDGTVVDVPKLYSNDYSVHVQAGGSDLIFETEHVINVRVKKGDTVKAGDVIAEVSDYDAKNYGGLGLFEIGILKGGNPPSHLCPFDYLDDSIKDDIFKKLTALKKSWEEYRGDANAYDESQVVVPGCLTRDPIEG